MEQETTIAGGFALPTRRSSDRDPRAARNTAIVLSVFAVVIAVHASGVLGPALYPVTLLAGSIAVAIGIRINRATLIWPWWTMAGAGALWAVAGILRDALDVTGDLTTSRSLVPDLFAVPGYAVFAIGLFGLVHAQRASRDLAAFADALLVAAGSSAIVFSLIVAPTLSMTGASLSARVSVAMYPAIAMFLLVGCAQMAFSQQRRSESVPLLVAGSACLAIAEVLFSLGETGQVDVPLRTLELPYLGAAAFFSAVALHPDTHRVHRRTGGVHREFGLGRLIAVTFAFVAPMVAVLFPATGSGRPFQILSCVLVTAVAMWRLLLASNSEVVLREELFRRATHDALTGLPSRSLIVEEASALVDDPNTEYATLMFLDLDGFKFVNDTLGHPAGDLLLMMVAERLTTTVRAEDVVGRISGDEFVVVCPNLDAAGAIALGDRIRNALRPPFDIDGSEARVGASVGVAIAGHDTDAETLLREADVAMYASKEQGRNRTTMFDIGMRDRAGDRLDLESGLRLALDRDEISVVFQPIVGTEHWRVEGFEALMRWTTETGPRSPADFIPVAEECGLIGAMGSYVLDEACRQIADWRARLGDHLTVSVNVAGSQLQSGRFVDEVADCLERHGLPGEALWLEIVETVMLDNSMSTESVLIGLEHLGVRLAVDDFGTGYASLTHLRTFPLSRIKIDRSFVTGMKNDPSAAALTRHVVALGTDLGLDVVAEGVETMDEQHQLASMGCGLIQGFLHSPGVPSVAVPDVVADIERACATLRFQSNSLEASR